jgi:outer membrane protein TolC
MPREPVPFVIPISCSSVLFARTLRRTLMVAWGLALLGWTSAAAAQGTPAADSALLGALRRANPELAARRAALEAAQAGVRGTGFAGPLRLSAEAEEIPDGLNLPGAGSLRVEVEREFLSPGRRAAQRALAGTDVRAAEAALRATEQRLLAEANRAVVRAAGAGLVARRLAAEDSLLVGAEDALRARFSVGEARYVDVLRLRTERLRIAGERAEALASAAAGRRALQTLLTPADAPAPDTLLDRLVRSSLDPLAGDTLPAPPDPDSLLARSGAAALVEATVERARAARALLAADQRPRLSASLGLQKFEGDRGALFGPTLGGSVTLPSTARQGNRAALAAGDARVAAAEAERTATLATLRGTLLAARERYEAARARLALFDAALLRGARQEREAALAAYSAGDLSLLELLDFERALSRAEIQRVQARVDAADALADLYSAAAAAGGFETPLFPASTDDDR